MFDVLRTPELREAARAVAEREQTAAGIRAAVPERIAATDRSGAVRVVLDVDGLPERIEVDAGWRRTLGSESVGSAVVDAHQAATARRATAWLSAQSGQAEPSHADPEPFLHDLGARVRQAADARGSMDAIVDEFDAVLHDVAVRAPEAEPVTAYGKVTLALGLDSSLACTVDAGWAAEHTADELAEALNRVLASARADLNGRAGPAPARRMEDATIAMLGLLHRVAEGPSTFEEH
ncbi:hypothetical protein [Asanoa siamensis]|uniref:YbaB/EbfC DNA-binding family protein n=1 Tax=Asanoa siamensis TaxID=926357 RepID=A0ABQ4CS05_9ACTN|nr:hypothetical protein [Asanoa siamensis]GIF73778.1 hypothetical protein Asi02nite_32960 [Asanoa siamensis]